MFGITESLTRTPHATAAVVGPLVWSPYLGFYTPFTDAVYAVRRFGLGTSYGRAIVQRCRNSCSYSNAHHAFTRSDDCADLRPAAASRHGVAIESTDATGHRLADRTAERIAGSGVAVTSVV